MADNFINTFVAGDFTSISLFDLIKNIILSGILASVVALYYKVHSEVVSDRAAFSNNFKYY